MRFTPPLTAFTKLGVISSHVIDVASPSFQATTGHPAHLALWLGGDLVWRRLFVGQAKIVTVNADFISTANVFLPSLLATKS